MNGYSCFIGIIAALLSCSLPASAATRTWGGGGANNFWSAPANWTNNVAPVLGDDLIFPAGAARLSNSNDFGAGISFHSITLSGSNYVINGNSLMLGSLGLANNAPVG